MIVKIELYDLFLETQLVSKVIGRWLNKKGRHRFNLVRIYPADFGVHRREKVDALAVADVLGLEKSAVFEFIESFVDRGIGRIGVRGKDVLIVRLEDYGAAIDKLIRKQVKERGY